jgi:hypothetical protein
MLIIFLFRTFLVYFVRNKALDIIYENKKNIRNLSKYYNDDHFLMIIDLRKWTFKQFYPKLAKWNV